MYTIAQMLYCSKPVCLIQIAGKLHRIITDMGLRDIGKLEQDLVFGDAGAKEMINFLRTKQVILTEFGISLLAFTIIQTSV